jgi:diaminopimelate decarboxylase
MRERLEHISQSDFAIANNELIVGDVPISTLVERSGGRPFFAYDRNIISRTVASLKAVLPPRISLHYAMKANPMPEVVQHLAGLTRGLDVASARELSVARETGIASEDISFAGPGKSDEDLLAGVDAGVIMVIESQTEARRIAELAAARGIRAPCAIRVNPDFQLKASGMKMGGGAQPFGIDAEQVPSVLESLRSQPLDIRGFHIFSGSQNLRPESIIETQRQTLDLAARLAPELSDGLRWLNIGGGLGVPYFPGDQRLDLEPIMRALAERLDEHAGLLENTEVVMELGRYLVASAGIYVCQVTDKKVSRGTTYLVTNGGLHHHLAVTGNFGQVIRKNYPVAVANRVASDDCERVTIVGPLCTPLDLLGKDMSLPKATVGDSIAVYMSGAYGFTASPQLFLSHPEPLEYCI